MKIFSTGGKEPRAEVIYDSFTGTTGGVLHVYIGALSIMLEVPRFWCWRRQWNADWRGAYR